jgi:hypothetical protein
VTTGRSGRIYLIDRSRGIETWFWGVSFEPTRKRSHGNVMSLEEAKAAFRAEYEAWQRETGTLT